jgi:predicted amidohydrolase YtcJ
MAFEGWRGKSGGDTSGQAANVRWKGILQPVDQKLLQWFAPRPPTARVEKASLGRAFHSTVSHGLTHVQLMGNSVVCPAFAAGDSKLDHDKDILR